MVGLSVHVGAEDACEDVVRIRLTLLVVTIGEAANEQALLIGKVVVEPCGEFVVGGYLGRKREIDKPASVPSRQISEQRYSTGTE